MTDISLADLRQTAMEHGDFAKAHEQNRIRRAIKEILFKLREAAGLTQVAVAERAGWHQPQVARLEAGDSQLTRALQQLERYASACDASVSLVFVSKKDREMREILPLNGSSAIADAVSSLADVSHVEADVATQLRDASAALQDAYRRVSEASRRLEDNAAASESAEAKASDAVSAPIRHRE